MEVIRYGKRGTQPIKEVAVYDLVKSKDPQTEQNAIEISGQWYFLRSVSNGLFKADELGANTDVSKLSLDDGIELIGESEYNVLVSAQPTQAQIAQQSLDAYNAAKGQ